MSAVGEAVQRPIRHEMMRIAGERVDGVTVHWPDGSTQEVRNYRLDELSIVEQSE